MNPTQTTTTPDPTPADVLRRAADHIDRHGFNQGSYYDNPTGPHPAACAAGGIAIASFGEPVPMPEIGEYPGPELYSRALGWLQSYLDANLGTYRGEPIGVYSWNDSPDTTGIDVTDMLRAAADAWDAHNHGGDRS
jgi:hypothetical protein